MLLLALAHVSEHVCVNVFRARRRVRVISLGGARQKFKFTHERKRVVVAVRVHAISFCTESETVSSESCESFAPRSTDRRHSGSGAWFYWRVPHLCRLESHSHVPTNKTHVSHLLVSLIFPFLHIMQRFFGRSSTLFWCIFIPVLAVVVARNDIFFR